MSAISQSVPYSSSWTDRPSAGQFPHLLFSHRDLNAASVEHSGDVLLKSIHYTTKKYPLMYSRQEQILKVFPYQALYSILESEMLYFWQSRVEIEHYSVAYFARIAVFQAL